MMAVLTLVRRREASALVKLATIGEGQNGMANVFGKVTPSVNDLGQGGISQICVERLKRGLYKPVYKPRIGVAASPSPVGRFGKRYTGLENRTRQGRRQRSTATPRIAYEAKPRGLFSLVPSAVDSPLPSPRAPTWALRAFSRAPKSPVEITAIGSPSQSLPLRP